MTLDTNESKDICSICGKRWQTHYAEGGRWKMGPFGTFDLIEDHLPFIPGVHAPRARADLESALNTGPTIPLAE